MVRARHLTLIMRVLVAFFLCIGLAHANLITSGDFESTSTRLTDWNTVEDIVLGTGGENPFSDKYTLLGSPVLAGFDSLSQSFALPNGTTQLVNRFSYNFGSADTSSWSSDTAKAALSPFPSILPIADQTLLEATSGNYRYGTYSGVVNVADWIVLDATNGNLRFTLPERLGKANRSFAIDNVKVSNVSHTLLHGAFWLLGTGLVGLVGIRRRMTN